MLAVIPPFTEDGVLPVGNWEASLEELRTSVLVKEPGAQYSDWDASWRLALVGNLEVVVRQLGKSELIESSSMDPLQRTKTTRTTSMATSNVTGTGSSRANCRMN